MGHTVQYFVPNVKCKQRILLSNINAKKTTISAKTYFLRFRNVIQFKSRVKHIYLMPFCPKTLRLLYRSKRLQKLCQP